MPLHTTVSGQGEVNHESGLPPRQLLEPFCSCTAIDLRSVWAFRILLLLLLLLFKEWSLGFFFFWVWYGNEVGLAVRRLMRGFWWKPDGSGELEMEGCLLRILYSPRDYISLLDGGCFSSRAAARWMENARASAARRHPLTFLFSFSSSFPSAF